MNTSLPWVQVFSCSPCLILVKGSYAKVEPGDCVVCFSRPDIFAVKKEIEKLTPYKCCVIYGTLPPAIRAEQARQFNDPNSGYEILIASDAIGERMNPLPLEL